MNVKKLKIPQRKAVLIALLVVGVGFLAWFIWASSNKGEDQSATPKSFDKVLTKGMEYADKGDVDGGLAYYDSQIEQAGDDTEKQQLLIYKSNFASGAARHEEAVESAKQADAIESNQASLMALALAYENEGNKEQAITFYRKLIEGAPEEENMGSRYRVEWEQKIEELQS